MVGSGFELVFDWCPSPIFPARGAFVQKEKPHTHVGGRGHLF